MPGMAGVAFSLHDALTRWQWSAFPLCTVAVLAAAGAWYLRADWQLATRGRRWPAGRTASFFGGLVAIDLAIQSPIATFTMDFFQAHVLQHLLLMVVAPPLLALGAPSTLFLQTAGRRAKQRWLAVLRSHPFAVISHPITTWILYFGVMFAFFLTSLINVAMTHMDLMDAMNVLFLFGGTLYWWPMVGIDPIIHWKMGYGARMLNILLASGVEAFLGVAILADAHPAASMYSLASTHSGGALLWTSTEFVTLGAFLPIYLQWTRSEDRASARADARAERADAAGAARLARGESAPREAIAMNAWEAEWLARTGSIPGLAAPRPPREPIPGAIRFRREAPARGVTESG